MILDTLDRASRYTACHAGFAQGIAFLQQLSLEKLEPGKHTIDGQRLFAIVAHEQGRGQEGAVLEFHRKYIDIQYVVSGHEMIGWRPLDQCHQIKQDYNEDSDYGLYSDRSKSWFEVLPQSHAPLASSGPVHKVVVKVSVDFAL
jgi:YhcH/YjgK/YiaL family protein